MRVAPPHYVVMYPRLFVARPAYNIRMLTDVARANQDHVFPANGDISLVRNAHYSNHRKQLEYILRHPYNSVEADVRLRDGVAVLAHDKGAKVELTFEEWATAVSSSGRMLRIDFKESKALPEVVRIIRKLGITADKLQFNFSVVSPREGSSYLAVPELQKLRRDFPESWITFNLPKPTMEVFAQLGQVGKQVGGRMCVSFQPKEVSVAAISAIHGYGMRINIWNDATQWGPDNVALETKRLRDLGIDGMIDLRRMDDPLIKN